MVNRAKNKEKAKRVLNENGNLSGMIGMEILFRVVFSITNLLLGAMIAGGVAVVSAILSAPFGLFGLAGLIIAFCIDYTCCVFYLVDRKRCYFRTV